MTTRLQIRKDTAANWTSNNPTLYSGEMGFETDTYKMKIGDGSTAWTSLPYIGNQQGFQNMELLTTGTSAAYNLPSIIKYTGGKFKVTLVGGGGQGGGSGTTSGQVGGGGGSGGLIVLYLSYVSGQNSFTYTVGTAGSGAAAGAAGNSGTDTTVIYNGITYTAGLGSGGSLNSTGGAGGTATGGTLNLVGGAGDNGGVMAATSNFIGNGANTPLGLGYGGRMPVTAGGATGNAGVGYGAGGSGGRTGTGTTSRAGGAGTAGVIIVEY